MSNSCPIAKGASAWTFSIATHRFHRVHDTEIGDRGDVDADVVAADDALGLNRHRDDANGQGKDEHDNNDHRDRDRNTDHDITPVSTAGAPAVDRVHRRSPADVPPSVTHRCWASCRDLSTVSFGCAIASKSATVASSDGCAAAAKIT